jgi:hypothetical protein
MDNELREIITRSDRALMAATADPICIWRRDLNTLIQAVKEGEQAKERLEEATSHIEWLKGQAKELSESPIHFNA